VLQLFIARALGLQALGQYTIALAYLNVCQVVSELGLQTLLVRDLAQVPSQRRSYFRLTLRLRLLISVVIWASLWGLTWLLPFDETTQMALRLVGATLPFYAVTATCQMLFQAGERMEFVMSIEVVINTLIIGCSLALLWLNSGVIALIGLLIVTQALSAAVCALLLMRSDLLAPPQETVSLSLLVLWRRAAPFYGLALADVLLHRLDILLLSLFGGAALTGIYSAAYNVVRVLIKVIQSIWQALYPTLSRLHHHAPQRYHRLCVQSVRYGMILVLPAVAVAAGVADELLTAIYGAHSVPVVSVFRVLLWMAPTFLLETYAILLFMVEHKPFYSLLLTALHLIGLLLCLPLLLVSYGAVGAALAALIASGGGAALGLVLLRSRRMPLQFVKMPHLLLITALVGCAGAFLPLPWLLRTTAAISVYCALLWITGLLTRADVQRVRQAFTGAQ
jgi:O-antigen/teichoic acid export membrane protein